MADDYWQKVREVFDRVIDLPKEQWESYITEHCETEVGQQVRDLLAAHDSVGDFIAAPIVPTLPLDSELPDDLVGARLSGRYVIEKRIGAGGFAEVFLARDEVLDNRPVVVKVLRRDPSGNQWLEDHFRAEMRALARIDDPGVVGILDVGQLASGTPYLVMQFVPGETLRQAIRRGPLALDRTVGLVSQLARALDAAHDKGILHRDLKPENIILKPMDQDTARPVIIDFGIASVFASMRVENVSTVVVGTQSYMSPEQLRGRPSAASDIYALGMIAREMLAGGLDATLPPHLPAGVAEAIRSATASDPIHRPATARQFAELLAATPPPATQKVWSTRRRWISASSAVAVFAVGGRAWFRSRPVPAPPVEDEVRIAVLDFRGAVIRDPLRREYRGGEQIRIELTASRPGYLYLVNQSPNGKPKYNLLFPGVKANGGSAAVPGAHTLHIPDNAASGLAFGGDPGEEVIWALWSRNPIPEVESVIHYTATAGGGVTEVTDQEILDRFFAIHHDAVRAVGESEAQGYWRLTPAGGLAAYSLRFHHR